MYVSYFGLQHAPFSIAPDPRYLFMSERHREALAHLVYGLQGGGGFVLLTGEIGAGKTTVCRCFLEQVPADCNVAYIFNPKLTVVELLRTICDEFHIEVLPAHAPADGLPPTVKDYLDPLNAFLLAAHAQGRSNVLIIDEAQNLSAEVLEQLRLLTNLETRERKLLQIVLIGQPELREMLARPELEQLAQRVIARYHLAPLSQAESRQYIAHRLAAAGLQRALPFDEAALRRIHVLARGVPRRINLLCDRALLGAFATGQATVGKAIVDQAADEVFGGAGMRAAPAGMRRGLAAGLVAGVMVGAAAVAGWTGWRPGASAGAGAPARAASTPADAAARPASAASPATVAAAAAAVPAPAAAPSAAASAPAIALASAAEFATALAAAVPRDERAAWRDLAALWHALPVDGDPCAALARQQLACLRDHATLPLLRQFDRPAWLLLRDAQAHPVPALLLGLGADHALLRLGGQTLRLPLTLLAGAWRGEYGSLWRTPPGYAAPLGDGQRGPAVDALAARLAQARGGAAPAGAQVVDAALKARLASFQLTQGLAPDGIAGPTTFMQLNRATGVDEPRLAVDPGR